MAECSCQIVRCCLYIISVFIILADCRSICKQIFDGFPGFRGVPIFCHRIPSFLYHFSYKSYMIRYFYAVFAGIFQGFNMFT